MRQAHRCRWRELKESGGDDDNSAPYRAEASGDWRNQCSLSNPRSANVAKTPKTPQATKVRIISAALGSIMTAQSKA